MRLITYKSKKLFYKKYLCKISFEFVLGDIFRSSWQKNNLDYAQRMIESYKEKLDEKFKQSNSKTSPVIEKGNYRKIRFGIEEVQDAELLRNSLLKIDDYQIRSEWGGKLVVYLNDSQQLLNDLKNLQIIDWIEVYEPDSALIANLDPNVLVSNLASDYDFKVTLNIGKIRNSNSNVLNWIKANRDKVKISDYGLEKAYSHIGVYVRDEKVLMLLQMAGHDYVKNIERLVSPSCSDK